MITKQFLKARPVCKTTFTVSDDAFEGNQLGLVGEFNNWNTDEPIAMTKKRNGKYSATVELPLDQEVQFRYVAGEQWLNDAEADGQVQTPFGSANSVVSTAR